MRRKSQFVGVWLSEDEYSNLMKQAAITGLSVSSVIRQLINGVELKPKPPQEYTALLRELSAIGKNINQIAHWSNARKNIHEAEIVEAAMLAKEAWRLVKDRL